MKNNKTINLKQVFNKILHSLDTKKGLNTQLNISFLRHLINFDFILNVDDIKVNTQSKSQNLVSIDAVALVAELKLMIRMLQFLSHKQKTKLNKFLYFLIESELHTEIFESCLSQLKKRAPKNIFKTKTESFWDSDFESELRGSPGKYINSLFLFDNPRNNSLKPVINEVNIMRRYVKNRSFLITKLNSSVEKKDFGVYKILNDLSDFKKIIFISCILNKVLCQKD